eukprot:750549-Hanusia_phi.AAC.7
MAGRHARLVVTVVALLLAGAGGEEGGGGGGGTEDNGSGFATLSYSFPDFESAMGNRKMQWGWWFQDDEDFCRKTMRELYDKNVRKRLSVQLQETEGNARADGDKSDSPRIPKIIHQVTPHGLGASSPHEHEDLTAVLTRSGWEETFQSSSLHGATPGCNCIRNGGTSCGRRRR